MRDRSRTPILVDEGLVALLVEGVALVLGLLAVGVVRREEVIFLWL